MRHEKLKICKIACKKVACYLHAISLFIYGAHVSIHRNMQPKLHRHKKETEDKTVNA